jgi:hypothetical protein
VLFRQAAEEKPNEIRVFRSPVECPTSLASSRHEVKRQYKIIDAFNARNASNARQDLAGLGCVHRAQLRFDGHDASRNHGGFMCRGSILLLVGRSRKSVESYPYLWEIFGSSTAGGWTTCPAFPCTATP